MTNAEQVLNEWIEFKQQERDAHIESALEAIKAAKRELDELETNLILAQADEPYLRPFRIDGVNAQKVYTAYGDIEAVAQLEKVALKGRQSEENV